MEARGATPCLGAARGGPARRGGVASLLPFFDSLSDFFEVSGKIGTLAFVLSNSENIS